MPNGLALAGLGSETHLKKYEKQYSLMEHREKAKQTDLIMTSPVVSEH